MRILNCLRWNVQFRFRWQPVGRQYDTLQTIVFKCGQTVIICLESPTYSKYYQLLLRLLISGLACVVLSEVRCVRCNWRISSLLAVDALRQNDLLQLTSCPPITKVPSSASSLVFVDFTVIGVTGNLSAWDEHRIYSAASQLDSATVRVMTTRAIHIGHSVA